MLVRMGDTFTFAAPGPGQWSLDRSHYPGAVTPISQWLQCEAMPAGMERVFAEIGAPVRRIDVAFVHGYHYTRVRPLIGGDRPTTKLPPTLVLKLVAHLHPEFRRRAKRAAATLRDKPYLDVVRRWDDELRPRVEAKNLAFQNVDLGALDDRALERHVGELLDHCREHMELHFWLHGHDIGPLARLIHESVRWGLDPRDVAEALVGASPSTSRPTELLVRIRGIVDASDTTIESLDDVRRCSPEAARLLDEYLAERGAILATGYDITALTLAELPGAVVSSIRSASLPRPANADAVAEQLRARVPAAERPMFDDHLDDARAVMDMRDDNGPLNAEWPLGLLRRALLEAGRRLVARGGLVEAEHALELTPDEARHVLSSTLPDAGAIARRAAARLATLSLDPPVTLGPDEPRPPVDVLPEPLPTLVGMVDTAMLHMGMSGSVSADPLVGVGVGSTAYTGRACTAASAEEAIEKLEPGDVLVVDATSPAFNAVLTIAGAVVTSHGGALSHAAVLARELGFAAVVGAPGACTIPDGATVEVDPVAGRVTVVDPSVVADRVS